MARGKPFLATYSSFDRILRLYRMDISGNFVSVASIGFTQNFAYLTGAAFINDSSNIATFQHLPIDESVGSPPFYAMQVRNLQDLSIKQSASLYSPDFANLHYGEIAGVTTHESFTVRRRFSSDIGDGQPESEVVSVVDSSMYRRVPAIGSKNYSSPTGKHYVNGETLYYIADHADTPEQNMPVWSSIALNANDTISVGAFSPDGKFFYYGGNSGLLIVYRILNNKAVKAFVKKFPRAIRDIAVHPSGRYLAVSHLDADLSTYKTVNMKRLGNELVEKSVHLAFGSHLNYTADGQYILNAFDRKAFSIDSATGVWTASTCISTITPGASLQWVSDHIDNLKIRGNIYRRGAQILQGLSDYSTLRVVYLNSVDNLFDADHTTMEQAIEEGWQTKYVLDNQYNLDGVTRIGDRLVFNGFTLNTVDNSVDVSVDDIDQIFPTGADPIKSAIIYHDGGSVKTPVYYLDARQVLNVGPELAYTIDTARSIFYKGHRNE